MSKRTGNIIRAVFFLTATGLLAWHVFLWNASGMYMTMYNWIGTDRVYITTLYNLGLMLVTGTALGLLLEKVNSGRIR